MTNNSSSLRSKLHAKKHVLKEKDLASPSTANDKYYFGEPKYAPGEVNFKDPDSDLFRYKQPGFKELVQRIPEPRAIDLWRRIM
jgi:hypothetical protein